MEVDTVHQSKVLVKILTFVGLWPRDFDEGQWYEKYLPSSVTLLLHTPITFTFIVLMWLQVFFETDLEKKYNVLYMVLTETDLFLKILSIMRHATIARDLLRSWSTEDEYRLETSEEKLKWSQAQKSFGRVSFVYIVCSISVVISGFIAELFIEHKNLAFPYWVPFDWTYPQPKYWIAYTYGFIAMLFTCISNITMDMMHCYLMLHVSLCFQVIGARLKALQAEKVPERTFHKLKRIVRVHQSVKRSAFLCEQVISYPSLAQILLSSFILCFCVYRLRNIKIGDDFGNFFSIVQYGMVMTLQIFLPCYYANEITISSDDLLNQLYHSDWINMSPANRRFIFLYMEYLKKPLILRAGHFFTIGLPIFTKTMNNSYSLLAVLLNMGRH